MLVPEYFPQKYTLWILIESGLYVNESFLMNIIYSKAPNKALFSSKKDWYRFLFLHANRHFGYSLGAPCWGSYNEYPQHILWFRNKKHIYLILTLIWSYDPGVFTLSNLPCFFCSRRHLFSFFLIFQRKQVLIFHVNRL